ncbi:serine hydrolase [Homoserinimonas sp. OAct 916]|uniref:serine hydrolase domain-containing protein n=1 Tax=Homoserinimonas sp. OAct 916 TaxID=2211450 RepID=UPI000DBE2A3D|nr:serine hydrolase domain-containing protein [Homoserinimonas sp. OAct 916]
MGRATRRSTRLLSLMLAAGLIGGLSACSASDAPAADPKPKPAGAFSPETVTQMEDAVSNAVAAAGASGAVAGVWAPWAGTWEAGIGATDRTGGKPVTTDMHFRIGTATRAMTCTVMLAVADQGTISIDDTVDKYLPGTPGVEGMTFRQLCHNTSGIGDYTPQLKQAFVSNPERIWPPLELLSSGLPLNRTGEPGAKYSSSNTGFILLGMALKAATGKTWPELYQEYIFGPLGMANTSYPTADDLSIPTEHPEGLAFEVDAKGAPICDAPTNVTSLSNSMFGVAGGVISTLDDSKTFVEALSRGSVLSDKAHQEQMELVPFSDKTPEGNGWGLGLDKTGPLLGATGDIPGYMVSMLTDPESGLTVVVALNNSAANAVLALQLGKQLAAIAAAAPVTITGTAEAPTIPWTAADTAAEVVRRGVCQPGTDGG